MSDITVRVREALSALCEDREEQKWGYAGWTRKVKEAVIGLATAAGHRAYASGAEGSSGREWLYDLCWLAYSAEKPETFLRTVAVLECEWGKDGDIQYDFEKLLVARAELRVMVYQAADKEHAGELFRKMVRLIKGYEQSCRGDRYLLSCWVADKRRFEHCPYVHGEEQSAAT